MDYNSTLPQCQDQGSESLNSEYLQNFLLGQGLPKEHPSGHRPTTWAWEPDESAPHSHPVPYISMVRALSRHRDLCFESYLKISNRNRARPPAELRSDETELHFPLYLHLHLPPPLDQQGHLAQYLETKLRRMQPWFCWEGLDSNRETITNKLAFQKIFDTTRVD